MNPVYGITSCLLFGLMVTVIRSNKLKPSHPHIIIIVADDLGWNDVSFHGSSQIPTPNIDSLAYTGVILNNYYVQPICTPTRSALLTARHPIHTGLQHDVLMGAQPYGLGLNETLLPQYLKKMGYATHAVGKWHLGFFAKQYTPAYRGFDSHFGFWQGAGDYWDHTYAEYYNGKNFVGVDLHENMQTVRNEAGMYSTNIFTSKAQQIIKNHNKSQPLFMYLAHQAVHSSDGDRAPLQAPQKYIQMFSHITDKNRQVFAAMTALMDESVGNVTRTLHDQGMLEDTIIVFTTDNGGPAAGMDRNWACNAPLRGRKRSVWEGGTRAAGFIWSPLLEAAGRVSNQLMHVTDWFPTLLSAAGYDTSELPQNLDGINLWYTLNNKSEESPRKEILYNIDDKVGAYAVRVGNYKLISEPRSPDWYPQPGLDQNSINNAINYYNQRSKDISLKYSPETQYGSNERNGIVKLGDMAKYAFSSDLYSIIRSLGLYATGSEPVIVKCGPKPANASINCQPDVSPCLYDLTSDPCEYNNIASEKPNILKQLQERLAFYNASAVPIKNVPVDPQGLPVYHNNAWEAWREL